MKIIIEGSETEIAKIVRENSIRVRRGLLSVTHVHEDPESDLTADTKDVNVNDSTDVDVSDTKENETADTKDVSLDDTAGSVVVESSRRRSCKK